jgi:transcriptional regulator with XRE-family HTH domain
MKTAKTKATSDALKILGRDDDSEMRAAIDEQVVRSQVAEMVLAAREARRLTQAALAKLMGTRQSVISRIEDADDSGSVTVATLTRLFSVLGMSLSFRAVPEAADAVSKRSRRRELPVRMGRSPRKSGARFGRRSAAGT